MNGGFLIPRVELLVFVLFCCSSFTSQWFCRVACAAPSIDEFRVHPSVSVNFDTVFCFYKRYQLKAHDYHFRFLELPSSTNLSWTKSSSFCQECMYCGCCVCVAGSMATFGTVTRIYVHMQPTVVSRILFHPCLLPKARVIRKMWTVTKLQRTESSSSGRSCAARVLDGSQGLKGTDMSTEFLCGSEVRKIIE